MTIITIAEPKIAPFDLFSSDRKSSLISTEATTQLNELSWEAIVVKNYCLAVNQQTEIKLDKIPCLQKVQEQSRATANLWLKEISIAINEVYNETDFFCDSFTEISKKLKTYAQDLSNPENRELFISQIKNLKNDVWEINKRIKALNKQLPGIRSRFERDIRSFGEIVREAKKIALNNKPTLESLEREINNLSEQIKDLNKKIAAAASVGTVGALGFIIGIVVLGFLTSLLGGITTPFIVGAVIGITTTVGMGAAGYTKLVHFTDQVKQKNAEYKQKNEQLQKIQAETATAIAIEKQYQPLIASGRTAIQAIQALYEEWSSIFSNFDHFSEQVSRARHAESEKIGMHVQNLEGVVKILQDTIALHKERGLIKSVIEAPVASVLKPSYAKVGNTQVLYLATRLHLAYSNRMHRQYSTV